MSRRTVSYLVVVLILVGMGCAWYAWQESADPLSAVPSQRPIVVRTTAQKLMVHGKRSAPPCPLGGTRSAVNRPSALKL